MAETETIITLGGKRYAIRPLTIGQLSKILPAFAKAYAMQGEGAVDAALTIIAAALARDHAELTMNDLMGHEATVPELLAATTTIGRLSGLKILTPEELAKLAASGETRPATP